MQPTKSSERFRSNHVCYKVVSSGGARGASRQWLLIIQNVRRSRSVRDDSVTNEAFPEHIMARRNTRQFSLRTALAEARTSRFCKMSCRAPRRTDIAFLKQRAIRINFAPLLTAHTLLNTTNIHSNREVNPR